MATILDLFLSNPDLVGAPSNRETPEEHFEHGIEVTYESSDIPNELPGPKTPVEILKDSIRIQSLVDINNPLIYGSDVPRIASRSTRTLEIMKEGRGITEGNAGLIGKGISAITGGKLSSINDVRNKIGDFLGLPQPYIPTVVASKLEPGVTVQDILDKRDGTEVGKLLKDSVIGGNPETIIKQGLGTAIQFGKDKLRNALFGNPFAIDDVAGSANQKFQGIYTDQNTYTIVTDKQKLKDPIDTNETFAINYEINHEHIKKINLADYSPIYGVDRDSNLWDSDLGARIKQDRDTNPNLAKRLQPYDPINTYTGKVEPSGDKIDRPPIWERSLENKYKLSSKSDGVNLISPTKTELPLKEREEMDLVPFWVGIVGPETDIIKKTHFRALLTGISETVTPSWNSNKFYGNPFEFYTYSGVSRAVTFSLMIYCSNPVELAYNWEKINALTKYTYPTIGDTKTEGKVMNPPIIDFRLGDIYNTQTGYISSLSYTFPENGTWETDPKIGLLPKIIEVSVSIDFIETAGENLSKLYGYTISEAAAARMNEDSGLNGFSTNPNVLSNGSVVPEKKIKVTTKKLDTTFGIKSQPTTIGGVKLSSLDELTSGITNPLNSESGISDIGSKLKTGTDELNPVQQDVWNNTLKPKGFGNYYGDGFPVEPGSRIYKNLGTNEIVEMDVNGDIFTLSERN